MSTRISPTERKHFDYFYDQVSRSFPKDCKVCGKVWGNEEDYVRDTHELPGIWDSYDLEVGMLVFLRNCSCRSTLGIRLDDSEKIDEWAEFVAYVQHRAKRNSRAFHEELQEVRREYNQVYLPERIEQERLRIH